MFTVLGDVKGCFRCGYSFGLDVSCGEVIRDLGLFRIRGY